MVGYEKDDILSPNQKLIAGCVSGCVTRFITQPLDIIKLRTQLQKKPATGNRRFFPTTRAILKEEGVTAFWHGHNLGQLHSILAVSSQFYVYELTTKYVMNTIHPDNKGFFLFFCGIFAGCCSATLVIPIEVIRVRQMLVKAQYGGILSGARRVYASGGILAFYEGLGASLLQMGPSCGISFGVFKFVQPLILEYVAPKCQGEHCVHSTSGNVYKPEYVLLASTAAGSLAGFLAKTFTYPFDLAKRRLQISSHKEDHKAPPPPSARDLIRCHNLLECLIMTAKKEGIFGLYRGWTITSYEHNIRSGCLFATYELICYALREKKAYHP
ncbi:mitochondrial thiamine pyrophosphate carrier-like isoform X2 [Choristoneura fumiferana]|uniref:mitochondrial thiamine pyrophosphate carrier-like isoform X2 n=1 Tax=Choristoneura fumiferana TaxID=7141 RepID=UPI003D157C1A